MMFLSNEWIMWVAEEYSMLLGATPVILGILLKLLAIMHPDVDRDDIVGFLRALGRRK